MRVALVLLALSAGVAASAASAGPAQTGTSLRVAYWENGSGAKPDEVWTLRCDPARGTLTKPRAACEKLSTGGTKLFAPVPKGMACTEIYGGPQKALVSGLVDGKRVRTTLSRSDGCQIERWSRLAPWLLPPGGATT